MIIRLSKFELPVSRRMLVASLILHGALIVTLIYYGYLEMDMKKPPEPEVTPVKIVAVPEGVPDVQRIEPGPTDVPPVAREPDIKDAARIQDQPVPQHHLIKAETLKPERQRRIPVKKQRRPIRTVEPPKPKPETAEPQPKEKKEDPQKALDKRLAEIRDRLKKQSKESQNRTGLPGGSDPDALAVDRELLLWFGSVRKLINDHWAVIRGSAMEKRVAIVALELSREGGLVRTSVIKSSQDRLFDLSVERAIHQAAPFPPIPPPVWEKIREEGGLELRFNSRGLE